jgi:hypothetical protein
MLLHQYPNHQVMIASCSQLVGCRAKMDSIPGESLLPTMILVAYALVTVW